MPQEASEPVDRRKFLLTAAGAAVAGAAVGAAGLGTAWLWSNRIEAARMKWIGARRIGGPAPKGLPMIPVRVNSAGEVEAVPNLRTAASSHSMAWHAYCGRQGAPGLDPAWTDDNVFRYSINPAKVTKAERDGHALWYKDFLDQPMRAEHFTRPWQGASVRWRSEGQEQNNILTAIVLKLDRASVTGNIPEGFADDGFIAFDAGCTHFCCQADYMISKIAQANGQFDKLFCTCHESVFDPRSLADYTGVPDEDEA